MPYTEIIFFHNGRRTPVLDWLQKLKKQDAQAYIKCKAKIKYLESFGYELRRPHVDYLENGIYELRIRMINVQYRILFFYYGKNAVILSNAITKYEKIPPIEIKRCIKNRKIFESNPLKYRKVEEI
mgnify:CR=1 FL=1